MPTESVPVTQTADSAVPARREAIAAPCGPTIDSLSSLLAGVEPLGRQALLLIYADGVTQREAARRLGMSDRRVARVVWAAMRRVCAGIEGPTRSVPGLD